MVKGKTHDLQEIIMALNRFEAVLRTAVRKDTMAEMAEEWAPAKLKAVERAWAAAKEARIELEAKIRALHVEDLYNEKTKDQRPE